MKKRGLYIFFILLLSSINCYALTIQAGVASREIHSDTSTVVRNTSGSWDVVTQPFVEPESGGRCVVLAFILPELPEGKMIAEAKFSIYYTGRDPERTGPEDSLYAISCRGESTITADDYYEGEFCGDMDNCAIQSDLVDYDIEGAWHTTRAFGTQRLTKFMRRQYENGAAGGEWFFLRINSEMDGYNYYSRHSYASVYYNGGTTWSPSPYTPYIDYTLKDAEVMSVDEKVETAKAPEFTPGIDQELLQAPIEQQPYFLCETERLGYNPRYPVNSLGFDSQNRPYIRKKFAVCTLNSQDKWVTLDFKKFLTDAFPQWDGTLASFGPASDDRVVFDNDDDAYTLVNLTGIGEVLMHSRDYCRSWDVIPLFETVATAKMEFRGGHNDLAYPPTIVTRTYKPTGGAAVLDLITPIKEADGTIRIPKLIPISRGDGFYVSVLGGGLNTGKGSANLSVSLGDMVHVVFAGRYTVNEEAGTPQYIVSYNRSTNYVSPAVYLGSAGIEVPDEHNWPGVSLDSQGYVHAVLGAHGGKSGQCFKHCVSLSPNDSTQMSPPVNLPSGFTYLSLLCDSQDNLHVVARDHWDTYVQKLKHLSKTSGGDWPLEKNELVVPFIVPEAEYTYNRYDQTLDIDRKGNMYVAYWNGSRVVIGDEPAEKAFEMKWPNEDFIHTTDGEWTSDIYYDMHSADSRCGAVLVSKDNGASWKLLETKDFNEVDGSMPALPQTREVHGCAGPVENTGETWQVVFADQACDPAEYAYTVLVMAFQVPELPEGYEFTSADMNLFYHYQKRWGSPIDAYGLGYRSGVSPNITSDDFYIGDNDTTDAVLIQKNMLDFEFGVGTWQTLSPEGITNMTDYLNAQLANGAQGGDWILVRLNIQYRYTTWYSAHAIRSCYYSDPSYHPYIKYKASPAR